MCLIDVEYKKKINNKKEGCININHNFIPIVFIVLKLLKTRKIFFRVILFAVMYYLRRKLTISLYGIIFLCVYFILLSFVRVFAYSSAKLNRNSPWLSLFLLKWEPLLKGVFLLRFLIKVSKKKHNNKTKIIFSFQTNKKYK